MKRALVVVLSVAVLMVVLASVALAAPTTENQGWHSQGRNDNAVAGGPHCHTLVSEQPAEGFLIYPSHKAHLATGGLDSHVFAGAACPTP